RRGVREACAGTACARRRPPAEGPTADPELLAGALGDARKTSRVDRGSTGRLDPDGDRVECRVAGDRVDDRRVGDVVDARAGLLRGQSPADARAHVPEP